MTRIEQVPESFRACATNVIRERIQRLLTFIRRVRRGNDAEAVHDMRVASRRLRAALSVFAEAFDDPAYARLTKEIRKVTSALSRARDLDVMVANLEKEATRLPATQRALLADLIRELTEERREAQRDVVAVLDQLNDFDPLGVFDQVVASVTSPVAEPQAGGQTDES